MKFSRASNAYVPLDGGLNTEASRLNLKPGQFYSGINHCFADPIGYERIDGYEAFDGHEKPSEARFTLLIGTFAADCSVGDIVTGSTSGNTGVVLVDYNSSSVGLVVYTAGNFTIGEDVTNGGIVLSNVADISKGFGASNPQDQRDWNILAGDEARKAIQQAPGTGDVIGAVKFNNKVFAFRGGGVYFSSATGWQSLTLGQIVPFTVGTASTPNRPPIKGDTVSNGTVSADVVNVQEKSGNWGSSNVEGWIVIKNKTGGTFATSDSLTFTGGATATSGDEVQITRNSGGYLRSRVANFTGASNDLALWGADGVNQGFKIDKDNNYIPIYTGFEDQGAPEQIEVFHHHLFLSYGSNWVHSGIGDPFAPWTLISGADQWGMGDYIVGSAITPNGTMISFGENSIDVVYGSSSADFTVKPYSSEFGAIKNSVQVSMAPTYVGEAGVQVMTQTQKWGDFEVNDIDAVVKTLIDGIKSRITCSVVFRNKNEYRVYADNQCVRLKFVGGKIRGFTKDVYDIPIHNISATVRDGVTKDEVFFVSNTGYVYQLDSGDSFDGKDITAFLFLAQHHGGSTRERKRWYNTVVEVDAEGMTEFSVKHDFSLFHPYKHESFSHDVSAIQEGGIWDVSRWNKAVWGDGRTDMFYTVNAGGVSTGVGMMFYSKHRYPKYLIRSLNHRFAFRSQERW